MKRELVRITSTGLLV